MALYGQPIFICLLCLLFCFSISSQTLISEICDNAIDDDHDGLIDIQDEDCFCAEWKPESLAPNPSFEQFDCCPESASMVSCATHWIQASAATSDFFHACNYDGSDIFNLPQPIPDGEGFIGFIDGVFTNDFNPNWKEYVGTCLRDPLQADSSYQLQFYIGFVDREDSPEINVALFGTADCNNLPFGDGDQSFGCPSRSPKWVRLGGVSAAGHNEWKQEEFIFKSLINIQAIAIGPDCSTRSSNSNPYHFLDQVVLAKLNEFDVDIHADNDLCSSNFSLSIREQVNTSYQWYKNGIAMIDATKARLINPPGRGSYQVRIDNERACRLSSPYNYFPPFESVTLNEISCSGKPYTFGDKQLTIEGNYRDTFKMENNCDSIVLLNLTIEMPTINDISVRIFPGEQFIVGDMVFDSPGDYQQTIRSAAGCDSTVHLHLSNYSLYIPQAFSPNADNTNDVFSLYSDSGLQSISNLLIFDRNGNPMFEGKNLQAGEGWNGNVNTKPAAAGIYIFLADVLYDDNVERKLKGTFMLFR